MANLTDRANLFLEKNFLGKVDANTRLRGRNRRQVPLPDKGLGVGVTTFMGAVGGGQASPAMALRCLAIRVDSWQNAMRLIHHQYQTIPT